MTEAATEAAATETAETTTTAEATETQQKPTETVEFWRDKAREQEKRAKSNAEAAKRLAEIEDAQKTESQKAAEALAKAEQRASAAEQRATALSIATEHKLGKDDAETLALLPDEDSMRKLAQRLAGQAAEQKKNGNRVPSEGTVTKPPATDERTFVRNLFGSGS
jgi:hypothetical protein